jgi:endonuclease YncB( thermonuclease family)
MRAGFTWYLFAAAMAVLLWWMLGSSDQNGGRQATATQTIAPAPVESKPPQSPAETPALDGAPEEQTRNLLANEQAEAERHAVLKEKREEAPAKTKPVAATKLYYKVVVRDGGTLEAGGTIIKLDRIAARGAKEICKDEQGNTWPCGAAARAALTRLIRSRAVSCSLPPGGEAKAFAAQCRVGDTDLAEWMVRQGWAEPSEPAGLAMKGAARAARQDRIGVWRAAE